MRFPFKAAAALVIVALLVYAGVRLFVHSGKLLEPVIVTKNMDVHHALSPSLGARVDRLLHDPAERDRANRPKLIALTFDDGPYPVTTPLLLETLRDLHVKATFFYIGRDAELYPELTQRTQQDGNEIADHTLTHPNLDELSPEAVAAEITQGAKVLHRYSNDPGIDEFFRPPHGRYTEETVSVAKKLGYHTILWTDDPGDWRTVTGEELRAHITEHATAPEIILLHSGRLPTIEMLPDLIRSFRADGYEFVTVGQLMRRVPADQINHPAKHAAA